MCEHAFNRSPTGIAHQLVVANGMGGAHAFFHIACIHADGILVCPDPGIAIGLQFHADL